MAANDAMRAYGDPNPTFSGQLTGVLNNDNILAIYTSTTTPTTAIGNSPIIPSLVDPDGKSANYTITSSNGTLTITKAPLNVTADSFTRAYGSANPPLTGTLTGVKNNENITATFATSATTTSPVGAYTITPTLLDPASKLSNYALTSVNGLLTVAKATLTVTPTDLSKTYGTPNPTLTGTITGLQNNDNISATYATSAATSSPAGKYTISATLSDPGNKLAFYTLAKPDGTLTINKATPTITWPTPDRIFAGVALSPTQLNATAADPNSASPLTGTFTYTPPAGTTVSPNPAQTLNVAFQPDDAANYTSASATNTLTVDPATPVNITSALSATIQKLDPFTYIITADGSAPLSYAATPLPDGLTLSGNTISGNPTSTGVFYVLLTASNVGNQDSKTLKLTITQADNQAPVIGSLSATPNPAPIGVPVTFSALASDINGDSLDYTWDFGDQTFGSGASVSKTYAAAGAYIAKLTVSDGQSTTTQTLNLAVQQQPDAVAFSIYKINLSFNFIKKGKDSLSLSGQIPLPPTFKPDGKSVRILIGNLDRTLTLDSKGKSSDKSFAFKGSLNDTSATFTYVIKNNALFDSLSVLGFGKSSPNDKIDLPIVLVLDGTSHLVHINVDYSVKTKKDIPQSAIGKN